MRCMLRYICSVLMGVTGFVFSGWAQEVTLTLRSHLNFPGSFHTDVWGYVDPNTGREFALLGDASSSGGLTIIEVTNPDQPVPVAAVNTVPGFDVKAWSHYAYTVNGGSSGLGGIVDIADPTNPQVVGSFPSSHNIFISPGGYMFLEFLGLRIFDLNPDPTQPTLIWSGGSEGHDATVRGNRLYDFHGSVGTRIYDITTINNPQLLGSITDPTISYHHSGDVTADHRYLFICDELASGNQADISVWDIADPTNPQRVDDFTDPNAIVHNLYIVQNFAFVSYYTAGLRVFDVSDPTHITLVAEYDTSPLSGEVFGGAFGVYPFSPNGLIFINDWQEGLFVFTFDGLVGTGGEPVAGNQPESFILDQNFPNPFNPTTTIAFHLPHVSRITLHVFDVTGRRVRTLVNGKLPAGAHRVVWDGTDDGGRAVAGGVYFYRLQAGDFVATRKMLLIK